MRSILITGSSSGIGHDAAKALHSEGWRVLATCRKQSDCDELVALGMESFVLDYADPDSVQAGARKALEMTDGNLEALFNNGAYAAPGLVEDLPRGALREIFEVKLFGQIELINCLIPAMRKLDKSYIINNSSVLGFVGMPYRGAYCATKFAMEGMTDTLRLELAETGIQVVLIEPGPIASRIRQNSVAHFERWINVDESAQAERYRKQLIPRLYDKNELPDRFELPASAVTNKLLRIVNSKIPRPRYYVTTPTYLSGYAKRLLSTRMFDRFLSLR